ncbi:MAG: DUF971 domain-containing protein [Actinomycetota bacterium]
MTDPSERHQVMNIDVDRSAFVRVEFVDGVSAEFPLVGLRLACPCADCNTRRQQGRSVSVLADSKPEELTISHIAMQGAWGLNIDWSDGHATGIYAFEKLRNWADAGLADVTVT